VLLLNMVDTSRSLSKPLSGRFFVSGQSGQTFSSRSEAPSDIFCGHLQRLVGGMTMQPALATMALKRKPKARGTRVHPLLSPVGSFSLLPELRSATESVAPPACPLARAAAGALPAALRVVAPHGNRRATTADGPAGVEQAWLSPRCGVRAQLSHDDPSD
jgi:hypothetical protein